MSEKILSVFIDESGDFGPYAPHSPFYLVSMVLHNQTIDLTSSIANFERQLHNLGYSHHAVHTGPLIRRESVYQNEFIRTRKALFNSLFHFSRKASINYTCIKIKKIESPNAAVQAKKLTKEIIHALRTNESFWNSFDRIIIYYDNGQVELTKILISAFDTLYTNVEFRKVAPIDYKLFQVADLICTLELLSEKAMANSFSRSEIEFFDNVRNFKKNYLKPIRQKQI